MTFAKTSICAKYKSVDGWHIFDSDDLPGLYVASRDAATAYKDVAPAIVTLIELDEGIKVEARAELSLSEFLESVKGEVPEQHLVMSDKRFSVESMIAA
jgi:hypothetical protein